MAEASVQFLLENLSSLIQGEIGLIMGVGDEMTKLSTTLTTIRTVLNDAENRQFEEEDVRGWLCNLYQITYEIEDILDDFATEVSKANLKSFYNPIQCFKKIPDRSNIGRRIIEVTKKLDESVAQNQLRLNLRGGIIEEQTYRSDASIRETSSFLNESHPVYGRDEDKEIIVDILVNKFRECTELSVLPIIGMGGLGKTTLAQLVFNDQRVADHFQIKLWVCVSDVFDHKTLIKAILKSSPENESSNLDFLHLEGLQRRLSELLSNKRYLLVLDDVWNEDQGKWDDELKSSLSCGSSGASIVVTTRLPIVADIMSTYPAHNLAELSEEHCWLIFKQYAFKKQEEEYPNLDAIGKQIVKKCGGVPLAAKSLGGLLRFKRNEKEWIKVKESEVWNLPSTEKSIMPALKLSYKHLSSTLKQCFAFCAIFPKDTLIKKDELIHMWIAHGYISSSGTMEVEDIGDGIWNELALRGLFQDISTNRYQFIDSISFTMHDLVHDLAQTIMEDKAVGTQVEISNTSAAPNTKIRQVDLNLKNCSVAFPTNTLPSMDLTSALKRYTRLRFLNASLTGIKVLPCAIGKLKHLRSLDLSHNYGIRSLPDAICSLWNLKILNLDGCYELVSLPKKMKEMRNLRHLFLEGCFRLTKMPPNIGELSSLQTLSKFIVGHKKTKDELKELEGLNLGGVLEIKHLERVKSPEDAKIANLSQKQNLLVLILQWEFEVNDNSARGCDSDEKVLEALEPHPNLKRLEVNGFKGSNFPVWMGTLQNIVEIDIRKCPNCLCLPQVLGELPHLEKLVLRDLPLLQYILEKDDTAAGGQVNTVHTPKFPKLKSLAVCNLENLKGMLKKSDSREIIIFPNLQELHIYNCPEFVELNPEEIKYTLKSLGLENLPKMKSLLPDSLQHLTSLTSLDLSDLPLLTSLPDSLQHLTSLTSLKLRKLPLLTSLPDWLRNTATSLRSLTISDCPNISSLPDWLGNLTSLKNLEIDNCTNITSLPDTIQEMQNRRSLTIWECCPELKRRCEKAKGEDWPKIAHIPQLYIE